MRAASTPASPSAGSADDQYVSLPQDNDDQDEPITKLTMRKAKAEGEVETVPQGLGLDVTDKEKAD